MISRQEHDSKKQRRQEEKNQQEFESYTNQIQNVDSELWRELNLKFFCHVDNSLFVVGFFTNESGCHEMSFRLFGIDKFDTEFMTAAHENLYCLVVFTSADVTRFLQENEIGPAAMYRFLQGLKVNLEHSKDPADIFSLLQGTSDIPKPVQDYSNMMRITRIQNYNMHITDRENEETEDDLLLNKQLLNLAKRFRMDSFFKSRENVSTTDPARFMTKLDESTDTIQNPLDKLYPDRTYDMQQSRENASTTTPAHIMTELGERINTLEDKAKKIQYMFSKLHLDPPYDIQEIDISLDSSEATDNESTDDGFFQVKGCKCLCHRDNNDKNSRRAYKHHHEHSLPEIKLTTRQNVSHHNMNTSAGDAAVDGSSGDDSSSENDSESLHKHEEQKPSNRIMHHAEDIQKLDDAIDERDENAIEELLNAGNLPNLYQITHACERFGRESVVVTGICRVVSRWIHSQDDHIVRVEPAYRTESPAEAGVTFIIFLRQPIDDMKFGDLGFKVIVRVIGEYTSEGKEIVDKEVRKQLHFTLAEANRLNKWLEKHSEPLMEKHSNLQMISASHFKSKNYGKENIEETLCTCVVFYVKVKGFIPLTEERLPTNLDGIQTDIREGGFEFLSKATDRHTNLKMGCELAGELNQNGTIGPFLKENGNIYCLTTAHVLFGAPPDGKTEHEWPSTKSGCTKKVDVFQPNPNRSLFIYESFGSVYKAKYKQGGNNVSGIEVAVIHVEDKSRWPISGEFPQSGEVSHMEEDGGDDGNAVQSLTYNTGEICERDFLTKNNAVEVLKFGAVTGETRGLLKLDGTSVRFINCLTSDNKGILLYNQIEISNCDNQVFADFGDSGAVVLVAYGGNRRDLRALALLTGKSSTGTVIATPMYAIFDELGIINRKCMSFQKRNINTSISGDSAGFGQTALPMADAIQRHLEENYLQPRLESMEMTLKATISSEVQTQFHGFADQMMGWLNQNFPQNQAGNANDTIQNSGN